MKPYKTARAANSGALAALGDAAIVGTDYEVEKSASGWRWKQKTPAQKPKSDGLELPGETRPLADLAPGEEFAAHPAAEFFPMLQDKAADDFNADIRAHGVSQAVTLIDIDGARLMLDGRNRRRAAHLAGLSCPAELYIGVDPVRFVIARNLHRRHLTEGQRSMIAADAEGFTHGGRRVAGDVDKKPAITRDEAALMTGAAVRSVARAAFVKQKGSPELADAVREGKMAVSAAAQAATLPVEQQHKVIAEISAGRAKTAKQVLKRGRVAERNKKLKKTIVANPTRTYSVMLTDDEWQHETWSEQGQDRAATMHYSVSSGEELKARMLPAAEHAVYYAWSTVPHAALAQEVMKARGFTYRSQFIWWKIYPGNKPGLGYWSRIEHEILLIGTRGDIACPAPGDNWRSVQVSFVGEHSEKPEWSYRMIESYHPELIGTFMEFNARRRRRGWSAWGNEIGLIEPPPSELEAEFAAAPVLPDLDYLEIDRAFFHAMRKPSPPPKTIGDLAEAAAKAIAELPAEEPPENPDARALWLIEAGRVGEVSSDDLQRVIAAGYATPGRTRKRDGAQRPALISAHGAAELKAWRERMAEEAAEPHQSTRDSEVFFKAEADRRGIPEAPPLAGQGGDGIPDFLKREAGA